MYQLISKYNLFILSFTISPLSPNGGSVMQQFSERILNQARRSGVDLGTANIIEVGSGPGGLTFALAAQCGIGASIIGVDHSAHSTEVARQLLRGEAVRCVLADEGDAVTTMSIKIPSHITTTSSSATTTAATSTPSTAGTTTTANTTPALGTRRIDFRTADPMCLPAEMQHFDIVVLHDVIDAIASPNALLGRLGGVRGLVKPDGKGLLVVSSAYQWREECTPRGLWLGGFEAEGVANNTAADVATSSSAATANTVVRSEDTLVARLSEDFIHLGTEPLQQVWSEGQRQLNGRTYSLSFFTRKQL